MSQVIEFDHRYMIETVDGNRLLLVNFHSCGGWAKIADVLAGVVRQFCHDRVAVLRTLMMCRRTGCTSPVTC